MRRMADYHYAQATTWAELQAVHDRFFHDYNHQPHFAHRRADRRDGAVRPPCSGWVQGAWCDPADLDRLFRLRATRVLNAGGSVRFRHWRLYGERGLAGERAAVWVAGRDADASSTRPRPWPSTAVAFEADGRRLREVDEPRLFATGHASPQPFLPAVGGGGLAPGAAPGALPAAAAARGDGAQQERLLAPETDAATG